MNDRQFRQRMQAIYAQPDNAVAGLVVQKQSLEGWEQFDLSPLAPGFDIFVYSVLTCQHTYFRLNCAELGLLLAESQGEIAMLSDENWNLQSIGVTFVAELAQGEATDEAIDYIVERMGQCPVSRNIRDIPDIRTEVTFSSG